MRLAAPDTHEPARVMAESLLPADQVAAHLESERARIERHRVHA